MSTGLGLASISTVRTDTYLVATPATLRDWFVSTLAAVVFLPLYLRGFRRTGRPLLVISASIYLLGTAVTPINPGAICFFVYAIAFVPFAGSPRLAVRWLIVMLAGILVQAWAFNWPPATWVPAFLVGAVVGGTNARSAPVRRYCPQLPVGGDQQGGRTEPRRGGPSRTRERMALSRDRSIPTTNALQQDAVSRIAAQGIEAGFDDQVVKLKDRERRKPVRAT